MRLTACLLLLPVCLPAATAMQLLAANVMNPNEIDVSLDEISGLDEIVQDLVGRL